jgi:hypothetical protein
MDEANLKFYLSSSEHALKKLENYNKLLNRQQPFVIIYVYVLIFLNISADAPL